MIITVIFDLKPLGLIIRQITKQKDSDALIVSDIVEITDEKKKLIFRVNMTLYVVLFLMGIISFAYVFFVLGGYLSFNDLLFNFDNNTISLLGISIMIINGIVMIINASVGIMLQVELKKAYI